MTKKEMEVLELWIDGYGLVGVLDAISNICTEKSVHIAHAWQDVHTAKPWTMSANLLDNIIIHLDRFPTLKVDRPYLNEGRE